MEPKAFQIINFLAIVLSLSATALCVLGLTITGFYPEPLILLLLSLIPITSRFYTDKLIYEPEDIRRNKYRILTVINLLVIPVVLWMTFVITINRIMPNLQYLR